VLTIGNVIRRINIENAAMTVIFLSFGRELKEAIDLFLFWGCLFMTLNNVSTCYFEYRSYLLGFEKMEFPCLEDYFAQSFSLELRWQGFLIVSSVLLVFSFF